MRHPALALSVLAVAVIAALVIASPVGALSSQLPELEGGDGADAVTCATTPTLIRPVDRARSITIKNTSATAVYIGGSAVDATGGLSVCSSGCTYTNVVSFDAGRAWCMVASGTQAVYPTWGR